MSTPLGEFECSLGKTGITTGKREGDGATPAGNFEILFGYFRADRMPTPNCEVALSPIDASDGWCDDPVHPAYNRPIRLPFNASHEKMMREDRTVRHLPGARL